VDIRDLAELRVGLDAFAAAVSRPVPLAHVADGCVAGVPVREYRAQTGGSEVLVWAHGGGYVSGSLEAIDPVCRALAAKTGLTVLSVDYRLAPEHPFPAGLEDVLAVVRATPGAVAVGGDSAGGGLAAAVAPEVPGLRALVLLCPWLDATLASPSVRANSTPDGLSEQTLREFASLYGGDARDPRVSPLLAEDLAGLPSAVVVVAGDDPLRDEAEEYAGRIRAAGGQVELRRWDGVPHGFAGMTALLSEADEALEWAAERLLAALAIRPC
jgi:acetyl esterase